MIARLTSPEFVGRDAELVRLRRVLEAAESAGEGRLVLLGGDAGIGKTRLVAELSAWARDRGWLAVTGGCVDLGEVGLAYGPLVEVVRRLRAALGDATVDRLLDPSGASPAGQAGQELGVFGPLTEARPATADAATVPGRLLAWVVGFLERLGSATPALVVFEDLHWADQSTLELVAYLARNMPPAPTLVLATYRTDELHRRHPLRPLVAELHRHPAVERVEIGGLDRHEVAALVQGIGATPSGEEVVDELVARSEGNPFYVEELVASGTGRPLPGTLREVVLARVERLSEPAQVLLRRASVLGRDIDEAWLAGLTGLDADELADGLREMLAEQVLVGEATGCRFRHALVQEAVYGELLPDERRRLHVAAAQALEERPELAGGPDHVRLALLAHHWGAAADQPRCFAASIGAGTAAEAVGAFAEAAAHYERALDLWDRVPDPASTAGIDRVTVMRRAASSLNLSGFSSRAVVMASHALEELGHEAPPEERAAILERIGRYRWVSGDQSRSAAAYEAAANLLADRPPSHAKAQSMASLGQSLMLRSQLERAEPALRAAIDVARSIDDRAVEGHALCSLGTVLGDAGRVDEAVAMLARGLEIAEDEDLIEEVARGRVNLSDILSTSGGAEEAVAVVNAGLVHATETGLLPTYGRALAGNGGEALVRLGRWDEALAMVDRAASTSHDLGVTGLETTRAAVATARGDWATAKACVAVALDRTVASKDIMWRGWVLITAATLAAEQGRAADARPWADEAVELAAAADSARFGMPAFAVALRVVADRAELLAAQGSRAAEELVETRAAAARLLEQAHELAGKPARIGGTLVAEAAGWLSVVQAEAARAAGRPDPDAWRAVADQWESLAYPYLAAQARYQEAEAVLFSRGDRDRAARALGAAAEVADRLGAEPLATRVRTLARQARLTLTSPAGDRDGTGVTDGATRDDRDDGGSDGDGDGDGGADEIQALAGLGLTEREAEVLALVAEGLTNRQIGERLFISDKTASVHVSNLLRKLDLPSRTAAAALAHRLGAGQASRHRA